MPYFYRAFLLIDFYYISCYYVAQPTPHLPMITINRKEYTFQGALLHLVQKHLTNNSSEVSSFAQEWPMVEMTTHHTSSGRVVSQYVGSRDNEVDSIVRFIQAVLGVERRWLTTTLTGHEMELLQSLNRMETRCKVALGYLGRTKFNTRTISSFSIEDLCTAYAFFVEAKRFEQSYIFDVVLQEMCEPEKVQI